MMTLSPSTAFIWSASLYIVYYTQYVVFIILNINNMKNVESEETEYLTISNCVSS